MGNELNFDAEVSVSEVNKELNASIKSRKVNMGMYDNYPPGVSGNEFEIAGPDHEWEEEAECSNQNFEHVKVTPHFFEDCKKLSETLNHTNIGKPMTEELKKILVSVYNGIVLSDIDFQVETAECGFVGEVTKWSFHNEVHWTCPRCGKEYETFHDSRNRYGYDD